ncbi:MAG: hypothetical protein RI918_1528 [Pseudomonadota bacterium]
MNIGQYTLPNNLFVAPMAGVTDRPFRMLCKKLGAGYAVSEMVTSKRELWSTLKTSRRANHDGESAPIAVQIAGTSADMMAEAALYNIDNGAQIIDINMGCPAKKVCNKWAGSALMQDEGLALSIVEAVVAACAPRNVPVTLKMRTGWCQTHKNAVVLARAFEQAGVQMLAVHGRTREQGLAFTGADAIMVGRAAQGKPWIFREIAHYLDTGTHLAQPLVIEVKRLMCDHLLDHYDLYGEFSGVRTARKHIGWYVRSLPGGEAFRDSMNVLETCETQHAAVSQFFDALADQYERLPQSLVISQDEEADVLM